MRNCCSSSLSNTFPFVLFALSNSTFLTPLLLSATHFSSPQLKLQCHTLKRAPPGMSRGSSVTDNNFAYFTPYGSKEVYRYTINTDEWLHLPPCPHFHSALVIVDNELTAVGGYSGRSRTNKLVTLRQGRWVEEYPPIGRGRSCAACVGTSNVHDMNIIVIGGFGEGGWTTAVDLLNTHSRRWSTLTSLPKPLTGPSAVVRGDLLYVIGGNCVYSYSLSALPDSTRLDKSLPSPIWKPLPDLPLHNSTPAILAGQLVCVGGRGGSGGRSPRDDSIHQLVDRQWVKIGYLSIGRDDCLVVTPSPDKMLVVGGYPGFSHSDSVEMYEVIEYAFRHHSYTY